MCSFSRQVTSAAEHIQLYLDRSDRPVAGATYCALHELVDQLEASNFLQFATTVTTDSSTVKHPDPVAGEAELEAEQSSVQQSRCE
jgi:Caprin-1 dimerization domain